MKQMKQIGTKICSLFLALAMLCTVPGTTVFAGEADTSAVQTKGAGIGQTKEDAKKELAEYQKDKKKSCHAWDQILWDGRVLEAGTKIDEAQSEESIRAEVASAKTRIDQIISGVYKTTLQAEGTYDKSVRYAKRDLALAEMREYEAQFDQNNYFPSDWKTFQALVTAVHSNIDTIAKNKNIATGVADAISSIDLTVSNAKKDLANVPDKNDPIAIAKEKVRQEIQGYKDAAIAELNNNYTSKLGYYPSSMRKSLETKINNAIDEINRVELMEGENVAGGVNLDSKMYEKRIQQILLSAKDRLDNEMGQYDILTPDKAKAKKELENYKDPKNYRSAQKKELENAIAEGKKAINSAKTKEAIEQALKDAKAKIDQIKTDAQLKQEESSKKPAKVSPKKTSISGKIIALKKGFTVKWKKQTKDVGGYEVSYSTNKKFTKKTTVTKKAGKSATKLTVRKLKVKKKYYVRVRTYKTVKGKKYVSAWSSVKTVVTKK